MNAPDAVALSPILTAKEVSEYLPISETTLYRLSRRGEISKFQGGVEYRFRRDEIEKWMDEKQRPQER